MKKMHKIDLIFLIIIIFMGLLGGMLDVFCWKGVESGVFPVYSMMGIFVFYIFWNILFIYYSLFCKKNENKPKCLKWYMYFVLPFILIILTIIGIGLANIIIKFF